MAGSTPAQRPLAVTADENVLDDLVRLAAAAGVGLEVAYDVTAARRSWSTAPLVLAGDDLLPELARASPARRRDLVVVGRDLEDSAVWQRAVALGADHVVGLPAAESWLVDRLAEAAEGRPCDAVTVGVIGGRGGAGATTLAASIALTASRSGEHSLLIDGDPLGGGIDLVLGVETASGLRWPDLVTSQGRVSGGALRDALPAVEGLLVLSWDRGDPVAVPPHAMRAVVEAANRSGGVVLVDLPRALDDAAAEALTRCTTVLVVVPTEVRAVASARRVAALAGTLAGDVQVVTRGPAPGGLDSHAVGEALGLPVAGHLAPEPGLAARLERGEAPVRRPKGPLASFARRFLADQGTRQAEAA